jgi:N-methylhydantoinase A
MVRSAEMRYFGQLHDIDVILPEARIGAVFGEAEFKELIATFHARHEALYGWGDPDMPVLIALQKVRAIARRKPLMLTRHELAGPDAAAALKRKRRAYFKEGGGFIETPCYAGERLKPGNVITGPAIIEESKTTVVIPPGSEVTVDACENYLVKVS